MHLAALFGVQVSAQFSFMKCFIGHLLFGPIEQVLVADIGLATVHLNRRI